MAAAMAPPAHSGDADVPPANSPRATARRLRRPPQGGGLPLPWTMPADASPEFRALADAILSRERGDELSAGAAICLKTPPLLLLPKYASTSPYAGACPVVTCLRIDVYWSRRRDHRPWRASRRIVSGRWISRSF